MAEEGSASTGTEARAAVEDATFRLMFEQSADAMLLLDLAEGRFLACNEAALALLGFTRDEMDAVRSADLSPPTQPDGSSSNERGAALAHEALVKGSARFDWVLRGRRGDVTVEVLLNALRGAGDSRLIVVWRDVTERRREEAAVRQAQRLESLGMLASGVAHDFNNLLTAMLGHLDMAQGTFAPGHPADEHLARVAQALARAGDLTRQMLAYAGRGAVMRQPLDVGRTVRDMAELLRVSMPRGVRLTTELAAGLPRVEADATQVHQVVMNLVTNAADAMAGREGEVALRTGMIVLDEESARRDFVGQPLGPGLHVMLEVEDHGAGIAPDVLGHIFDPFFTTKQSGRGLGLSSLIGIMKGHGGGVHVRTRLGEGSTFRVVFPVRAEDPPVEDTRPVLVLERRAEARAALRVQLQGMGFPVVETSSLAEALDVLDVVSPRPRAVVADLGVETVPAVMELRRAAPAMPIVAGESLAPWTDEVLRDALARQGVVAG